MKRQILLLAALLCCAALVSAQGCFPPQVIEDFETSTAGSTTCSSTTSGTFPPGWTNDVSATTIWRADTGGTPSSGTGPSDDHSPTGPGYYLYVESSSPCFNQTAILNAPCLDPTGLAHPALRFWYHMYGATQGTLTVEEFDGASWNSIWSASGNHGDQWLFAQAAVHPVGGMVMVRFVCVTGSSFTSDTALDDVSLDELLGLDWETNGPAAHLDVDGVQTGPVALNPAQVNILGSACAPAPGTLHYGTNVPNSMYEIAWNASPLLGASAGGTITADGQIINLDLGAVLNWLNGGGAPALAPAPGAQLPGNQASMTTVPFALPPPMDLSVQGLFTDPGSSIGVSLTQATEIHAMGANTLPGPTADDSPAVTLDLLSTCWAPGGVPFYGTIYTEMFVNPNGRVTFNAGSSDWDPTLPEAMSGDPFVGCWTDFSPNAGGSVTMANPAPGVVSIDYQGVPYYPSNGANSFSIEFDANNGRVKLIGLQGVVPGPTENIFLGISPGAPNATDPGSMLFTPGFSGTAAAPTDMLYDFYDTSTMTGLPPSLLAGTNQLWFTPDGMGNYGWQAN